MVYKTIRILHECEVQIENSVTSVTVRHHEASTNNHVIIFFFLYTLPTTTTFKLQLTLFYQSHARITAFSSKKCSVRLLSKKLTSKRLAQNDVKIDVLTSCTRSSYTPCTRRKNGWKSWKTLSGIQEKNSPSPIQTSTNIVKITTSKFTWSPKVLDGSQCLEIF